AANGVFKGGNANVFGNGMVFGNGFAFGNDVAANGNTGDPGQILIRHLEELKQRMPDPALQALIDQQIQTMKNQK
ncbi:MAG: hypothetical protein ACK5MO_17340, partial [Planctomyces sp.]